MRRNSCFFCQGMPAMRWRKALKSLWALLLVLAYGLPLSAAAQTAGVPPPGGSVATAVPFAMVLRIRGEVYVLDAAGNISQRLREGSSIQVGQLVQAQGNAEALLKTGDSSLIAVRPGAEFVAERFAAKGNVDDNMALRLLRGGLRVITGWIGKTNRSAYVVNTSTATVGIRGTDHEPFVITDDLSARLVQPAGTYDKVNRGGTSLQGRGGDLNLEPGQVGYATATRNRALLTLALPVLLEKVPDFFVPGAFDSELDALSAGADDAAQRALEALRSHTAPAATNPVPAPPNPAPLPAVHVNTATSQGSPATVSVPALVPPATAEPEKVPPVVPAVPDRCGAQAIAKRWITALDDSIARRNETAILRMFDARVKVRVTLRKRDGTMEILDLGAQEFARSTVAALRGLSDYSQRRTTLDGQASRNCGRLTVTSSVIEQGLQNGQPYRFESTEVYVLEKRGANWIALEAQTQQR